MLCQSGSEIVVSSVMYPSIDLPYYAAFPGGISSTQDDTANGGSRNKHEAGGNHYLGGYFKQKTEGIIQKLSEFTPFKPLLKER